MSALPLKADMCNSLADVCFGPIADIHQLKKFDYIGRGRSLSDDKPATTFSAIEP